MTCTKEMKKKSRKKQGNKETDCKIQTVENLCPEADEDKNRKCRQVRLTMPIFILICFLFPTNHLISAWHRLPPKDQTTGVLAMQHHQMQSFGHAKSWPSKLLPLWPFSKPGARSGPQLTGGLSGSIVAPRRTHLAFRRLFCGESNTAVSLSLFFFFCFEPRDKNRDLVLAFAQMGS